MHVFGLCTEAHDGERAHRHDKQDTASRANRDQVTRHKSQGTSHNQRIVMLPVRSCVASDSSS
jgi:hypothetical protein